MFRKVLVANRGEIAVRVLDTLRRLGIGAVAVHDEADRAALHVRHADEAAAVDSYLDGEAIVSAARRLGVEAIHPGYGYLSENAAFASRCEEAEVRFIGPRPDVIAALGDKVTARRMMAAAGVPVVPGADDPTPDEARSVGFPLLVKAAAGGGGKGMRLVRAEADLPAALASAAAEARAAFGDGRVFVERCLERPRHVEFQVFGDDHGNAVHLYERECSVQRRHQKVVEESPSVALTPALRAEMGAAALLVARASGYTNAGTVEFLLDSDGRFYFLEVNARLQVEHPVTELLLRQDLVAAQLRVAAGEPLPFRAEDLRPEGHAVECRVYAEDAARGFMPSTGTIQAYRPPCAPYVRIDSGVERGSAVTVHHDPMLAKLVVWGADRGEALERMRWALRNFVILGVTTNLEFLHDLVAHPAFERGELHTHFLEEHPIGAAAGPAPVEAWLAAALTLERPAAGAAAAAATEASPWAAAGGWRL